MVGALILATVLLAQATPAAAPASTTVSPLVVSPQVSISKRRDVDLNAVTCHDELPPGTRFTIKVCATNRQFAERTRDQQEIVREWQNTPITTSGR